MSNVRIGHGQGRKPVSMGQASSQDAIWKGIRALKIFTGEELTIWLFNRGFSAINDATVRSYLVRLLRGGYLDTDCESVRNRVMRYRYTLIKNNGVEAPRLTKEGQPVTQGRGRKNLWRSMKVLREFDYRELAASSSTDEVEVKETTAKEYVVHLHKAGYLALIQPASNGGRLARYRLIPSRYTGPRPPQIQRTKHIYDANLGEVVWSSHAATEESH